MEIECLMEQKFNIDLNNKNRYINNMKIRDGIFIELKG